VKLLTAAVVVALSVSLMPSTSLAKKVYSPLVKQGELEVETQNEVYRSKNAGIDGKAKHQIEVSYGVTDFWHTGVYAVYEKPAGGSLAYTQTKWANIIQLTPPDTYWLNAGFYIEYIRAAENLNKDDVLEVKALLEKPIEHWKHTLNMVLKKTLASNTDTGLEYAWRSRYKMDSGLEPAIEIYGGLGTTKHLNVQDQTHLIGPVLEYEFFDGFEAAVGWLMNTSEGPAYGDFKLNIEYGF